MRLPDSPDDIVDNILGYDEALSDLESLTGKVRETMLQTVSRTMGWLLIFRDGRWLGGPVKYCASAAEMTPHDYERNRKGKLDPNAATNIVTELFFDGDHTWEDAEVDDKHQGAKALRAMAAKVGKSLKDSARFYVLRGEGISDAERAEVERLLGLVAAANLSERAREALLVRL